MRHAIFEPTVLFLVATLTIVACVGEGLHFIPGCGHGVEVGGRVLLLGIQLPIDAGDTDGQPRAERPGDQKIPIYDEDECAICSFAGRTCTPANSVSFIFVAPLVDCLAAVVPCAAPTGFARSFQARAPPLA